MSDSGVFGDSVYEGGEAVEDAENLDPVENLTGEDPDEIMQTGYNPPDREPHNLRDAPTPAEERDGPSLDDRLAAEQPDVDETTPDDVQSQERAGRLVAPEDGLGQRVEDTSVAEDVGPAGYASSAEEAAVHEIPEEQL